VTTLRLKHLALAAAVASTVAVGGCSGLEGMEMNGKLFDWLGVSPSAQDERRSEPRMADRAPLVMPPDTRRLPDPGAGLAPPSDVAGINDPDLTKAAKEKERDRLHMAYCRGEIQWKERALDPLKAGANRSPYGACPTLAPSFTGSINKQ
jgi:hypothetical protein